MNLLIKNSRKRAAHDTIAANCNCFRRLVVVLEDRAYGGGCEVLRGGKAKCISSWASGERFRGVTTVHRMLRREDPVQKQTSGSVRRTRYGRLAATMCDCKTDRLIKAE